MPRSRQGVLRRLVLVASLSASACGGDLERSTQTTGGASAESTALSGGAGSATTSGGNTSVFATMPSECAPETNPSSTNDSQPSTVEFILTNTTNEYRYVATDEVCDIDLEVLSCADGYRTSLIYPLCSVGCNGEFIGCIICTPCALSTLELAPASTSTATWSGTYATYETVMPGCDCIRIWPAPPGKYRAVFRVYATDPAVDTSSTPTTVTKDFDYPDEDGSVVIEVT